MINSIWEVASTAFFGFFQLGELLPESAQAFNSTTSLAWGDVAVDNRAAPRMLQVHPSVTARHRGRHHFGRDWELPVSSVSATPIHAGERHQAGAFFLRYMGG